MTPIRMSCNPSDLLGEAPGRGGRGWPVAAAGRDHDPVSVSPLGAPLSDEQFRYVCDLLHRMAGISLSGGKEALVRARLVKRLVALRLDSFDDYFRYLKADRQGIELNALVDALTTNQTHFFRESDQFDFLRDVVIPRDWARRPRLRIWCAGCSTGEEPYSIAMLLREEIGPPGGGKVRILGTDISERVLARARRGEYDEEALRSLGPARIRRHLGPAPAGGATTHRVITDELRQIVAFARLNLIDPWPMRGPFDAIFCRNVMIYFDTEVRERLIERFWHLLRPSGYLFVGSAESLSAVSHRFHYVRPAIFQRGES